MQAFNTITHPINQARKAGYRLGSQVLDVSHVDVSRSFIHVRWSIVCKQGYLFLCTHLLLRFTGDVDAVAIQLVIFSRTRTIFLRLALNNLFLLQLMAGKMMEQGPVLVISFNAQQIMVVYDSKGKVVEGDPVSLTKFGYSHFSGWRHGAVRWQLSVPSRPSEASRISSTCLSPFSLWCNLSGVQWCLP